MIFLIKALLNILASLMCFCGMFYVYEDEVSEILKFIKLIILIISFIIFAIFSIQDIIDFIRCK